MKYGKLIVRYQDPGSDAEQEWVLDCFDFQWALEKEPGIEVSSFGDPSPRWIGSGRPPRIKFEAALAQEATFRWVPLLARRVREALEDEAE